MESQMAQNPQPSPIASLVRSFGSFDAAHGWLVNLVVVVALLGIGACFVSARPAAVRIGVIAATVLCLATWVLVQDLGFLGGLGTDPNSMLPMIFVFTSGYLAMVRLPARASAAAAAPVSVSAPVMDAPVPVSVASDAERSEGVADVPASRLVGLHGSYLVRTLAAVGAVGIILIGAAPMALAATNFTADPIINTAVNGTPNYVNYPAPDFTLTNQSGATVSLKSLAGHAVVLTFLDPTCTSDCPLIAQELRVVDQMMGADATQVDLVAIVDNPLYTSTAATIAFDRQERMEQVPNWSYLTGPLDELHHIWDSYGVETQVSPAGAMIAHSDLVFLIDPSGRLRVVLISDPGDPGDGALHSSFSSTVTTLVRQLVHS
jgi:cytochrome oxidase Cu insertion factor (SCO1/SenC/PrrC family)